MTPPRRIRPFAGPRARDKVRPWRTLPTPPAIAKSDVRSIQPAYSSHNADFAGLNDLREIALAEVQICPDDGGWVAVGQIEQRLIDHSGNGYCGSNGTSRFSQMCAAARKGGSSVTTSPPSARLHK